MSSAATNSSMRKMPSWGDLKPGERLLVLAIRELSDETGRCTVSLDDLMQFTAFGESTVRTHIKSLLDQRRIKRRRNRSSSGAWGTCTYWLDLSALELAGTHADQAVATRPDSLNHPAPEIVADQKTEGGEIERQPQNLAVVATEPQKDSAHTPAPPREGERVSSIFDSSSFSIDGFQFRDDEQKRDCERVLSVCGPGLGGGQFFPRVVRSLIGVIDEWRSTFDFEKEILPVVQHQTGWERTAGPLCNFSLLTEDIQLFHEDPRLAVLKKRKHPKAKQLNSGATGSRGRVGSASSGRARLERLIRAFDDGDDLWIYLPPNERDLRGDERAAALSRLRFRWATELERLKRAR